MTKKSRYRAVPQAPRKPGLDTGKCRTISRSQHRPTTEDAESELLVAREIVKAVARLVLYVVARVAFLAVFAVFLLCAFRC